MYYSSFNTLYLPLFIKLFENSSNKVSLPLLLVWLRLI